jgi:hypothetical protein
VTADQSEAAAETGRALKLEILQEYRSNWHSPSESISLPDNIIGTL